ncbi:hypothetical protein E6O75_ATG07465 [Venturia nashicola]|uniref:Elongator complex protein 5 n=1 Tax=Venturia nashicola TaxID=86259 RepID=A0A4Z1P6L5_9PEZI|nr:hypothetical protein E6O75_ATG07465 [Venturia nashicola]
MSSAKQMQHRRTHNLILISKLLGCRENASPFTLILDSLEQSAKPLMNEMTSRANVSKIQIIYVSFSTLRKPKNVDVFIPACNFSIPELQKKIAGQISPQKRSLIIIDTLHPLLSNAHFSAPTFLSSLTSPSTSLLLTYHIDIPLVQTPHQPHPLTLLRYLATTIFQVYSFHHILAAKTARERTHAEPVFGLQEEIEGVLKGMGGNEGGVVVEMEYRRKSGRAVGEWFFLPSPTSHNTITSSVSGLKKPVQAGREMVILLEDHPLYNKPAEHEIPGNEDPDSTFNLGLTEKQRKDREGIVLPYFDAQGDGQVGEGGRILYEMGEEDDFDEEEDEI